jgi:hypothetical protein
MKHSTRLAMVGFAACAALVLVACKKKDAAAGGGGTGGAGSGAPASAAAVKFAEQELAFPDLKVKAQVPDGFKASKQEGMFTKFTWAEGEFSLDNRMTFSETCGGMCEASQWAANAKSEADQFIANVNDPNLFSPPAAAEVLENGEAVPGAYVLKLNIHPKDSSSKRSPTSRVMVWRYGPEWPSIVKCEFEANERMAGQLDAFRDACVGITFAGAVQADGG